MQSKYPILYGAYGANTNLRHMATRCPTARYVGNMIVEDYALVFRGVADIIPKRNATLHCALWRIMPADERALDLFEGFPNHYTKMIVDMAYKGGKRDVMLYIMAGNRRDRHEPPHSYEATLREGYAACNMPQEQIDDAIRDSLESSRRQLTYRGKWWRQDQPKNERADWLDNVSAEDRFNNDSAWLFDSSEKLS